MLEQISTALQDTLNQMITGFTNFIPLMIIGVIIIILGYALAAVLRMIVTRAGARLGIDAALARAGLSDQLVAAGVEKTPSALLGTIIFYMVVLNFLLAALEQMGLEDAVTPLQRLIDFLPTAIAGLITFVVGIMIAQFLGKTVSGALKSAGIEFHQTLGSATQMLVGGIVVVVVMEQIGLEASVLTTILSATIIVIIAGLALAFGLGGQTVTKNVLAGFYSRELFATGDVVIVDGEEGVLEGIGTLNAEIRIGADRLTVPNSRLTEGDVRKRE